MDRKRKTNQPYKRLGYKEIKEVSLTTGCVKSNIFKAIAKRTIPHYKVCGKIILNIKKIFTSIKKWKMGSN